MSLAEMKLMAVEAVMKLDVEQLKQLKNFLETIHELPVEKSIYVQHAQDIINERSSVLEKLAQ